MLVVPRTRLAGVMLLVMPAFTLVPLLVTSHFGEGAPQVATVQGFLGAGMVAGGLLMTALAPRRQLPWILGGFAVSALSVALIALTPPTLFVLAPAWWALTGLAFVAGNAPLTVGSVKFIVGEALKDETKRDNAGMAASVARCFASKDYVEGRTAFMEKRKPVFTGT